MSSYRSVNWCRTNSVNGNTSVPYRKNSSSVSDVPSPATPSHPAHLAIPSHPAHPAIPSHPAHPAIPSTHPATHSNTQYAIPTRLRSVSCEVTAPQDTQPSYDFHVRHSVSEQPAYYNPEVVSKPGSVGFNATPSKSTCANMSTNDPEKFLTARYPKRQMSLIRRRLAVEDWIDAELKKIYDVASDYETYDAVIDLDEVLDLDSECQRAAYIQDMLVTAPKSPAVIKTFIGEVLARCESL